MSIVSVVESDLDVTFELKRNQLITKVTAFKRDNALRR